MQDNLLRFKPKQKYVSFDTETESLSLAFSRPTELSWVVSEGDKVISKHERFMFWPDLNMSEGAARITRFDKFAWKAKAEDPRKVLEDFHKVLYNPEYLILGANLLGFDVYQINNAQRESGFPIDYSYVDRIIDVQSVQKSIYAGAKSIPEDRVSWSYQMQHYRKRGEKTNVKHLCGLYDIPYDPNKAHGGLYDSEKVIEIFRKQIFVIDI